MPGTVIYTNPLPLAEGQRVTIRVTSQQADLTWNYLTVKTASGKVAGVDVKGVKYKGFSSGIHTWHIYGRLTGNQDEAVVILSALALMPKTDEAATAALAATDYLDDFSDFSLPWFDIIKYFGLGYLGLLTYRWWFPGGVLKRNVSAAEDAHKVALGAGAQRPGRKRGGYWKNKMRP